MRPSASLLSCERPSVGADLRAARCEKRSPRRSAPACLPPRVPSPKSLGLSLRSKWVVCEARGRSIPHHFTLLQIWFFPAGIKMVRDMTDEQRSSRPIFNATAWAAASWPFFCVARSTVMIQIAALRSRLEKQPTDLRRNPRDLGDGALDVLYELWHRGFAHKH
jgi:hypothetical protein